MGGGKNLDQALNVKAQGGSKKRLALFLAPSTDVGSSALPENRGGKFFGKPDDEAQIYDSNTYVKDYTYLGIVGGTEDGLCRIEQRNKFSVGETIEIMKPDGRRSKGS